MGALCRIEGQVHVLGETKRYEKSYPIEVVEYATFLGIQDEPAFAWWTKDVLWK